MTVIGWVGFEVNVSPTSVAKLDPVQALRTYIECTAHIRPPDGAVFFTLPPPYKAVSHGTVSNILAEAIQTVDLDNKLYKPKDFPPTGATVQVRTLCPRKTPQRIVWTIY